MYRVGVNRCTEQCCALVYWSIGVLVNMCELTRPLTVRFSYMYQGISRFEHEEGLDGLEECIEPAQVKSIQITESACFITVVSNEMKQKLLLEGINIRGAYNNIVDVDRLITKVTLKDAPYKLGDSYIISI